MPDYRMASGSRDSYGPRDDMGSTRRTNDPRNMGDAFEPTGAASRMGPTFSVGAVGNRFSSAVDPGRTHGVGVGVRGKTRFKEGGKVKKMAKGGSTASKRGDGCCSKGKTKGKFV